MLASLAAGGLILSPLMAASASAATVAKASLNTAAQAADTAPASDVRHHGRKAGFGQGENWMLPVLGVAAAAGILAAILSSSHSNAPVSP
jgi:hypothetical protein